MVRVITIAGICKCGEEYEYVDSKWCKTCEINHLNKNYFTTSGNEEIDDLVREMRLQTKPYRKVFEWVSYNQLQNIKKVDKDGFNTIYSAIWRDGPLYYNDRTMEWTRKSDLRISLKYSYDPLNIFLNEVKTYDVDVYGISQNPDTNDYIIITRAEYCETCNKKYTDMYDKWCEPCQKNYFENEFTNWGSGNEEIDKFIQELRLIKICPYEVFEWVPYHQFDNIKKIGKDGFATIYSAIWKNGSLYWNGYKWTRELDQKVSLKLLHNSHKFINELFNEVGTYSGTHDGDIHTIHGISQDQNTKEYIIVFEDGYCEKCGKKYYDVKYGWCRSCQVDLRHYLKEEFITSKNSTIDHFIQQIQLSIDKQSGFIFEWIPFDKFMNFKKINEGIIYSAIWKDGPLFYDYENNELVRKPNRKVILKYSHNLQDLNKFLDEVKTYSTDDICGISLDPQTDYYVVVFHDGYCEECYQEYTDLNMEWCEPCQINYFREDFTEWTSENEINNYIKEMQLKIKPQSAVFEWIPYDQFNNIKEIGKDEFYTIYSAIWKDGPLYWDMIDSYKKIMWTRRSDERVTLKYLQSDSQNIIDEFLNKIKLYPIYSIFEDIIIYGISQDPSTKDYIIVLRDAYCEICHEQYTNMDHRKWCRRSFTRPINYLNWTSRQINEINGFFDEIKKMKMKPYDGLFEWIPFDQLKKINDIATRRLALYYNRIKELNEKVILKYLHNSKNITKEFLLNEAKEYLVESENNPKIYGISQDLNTKDYILVIQNEYCECNEKYTYIDFKWCTPCRINDLKNNFISFTNWTSKNKEIDDLIKKIQLNINHPKDMVVEWIPFNQFKNIKKISEDDIAAVYVAKWKDGPLNYDKSMGWKRVQYKNVVLKNLFNSQNNGNQFYNEIKTYSTIEPNFKEDDKILTLFGISQDSYTKNYIIVLQDGSYCENCGKHKQYKHEQYVFTNYNSCCKQCDEINYLENNFTNWTSGNEKIDKFIQNMQLEAIKSNFIKIEWIPYSNLCKIRKIGKGGFATVYSAMWKSGPLYYDHHIKEWKRDSNKMVVLKNLDNSQNITDQFLDEVKACSTEFFNNIIKIYGLSQNPNTKDYIIVLEHIDGGNLNDWMNENYNYLNWKHKLKILTSIINGLEEIHQKQMVHRDFHTGNILISTIHEQSFYFEDLKACVSDMGLCGEVDNVDKTKIYGVMPYVAPEVLRGDPYTQAADIYSFGMILYFVATGKQPFADRAHDLNLALNICNGTRPEINELETPKCYIDLMKKCWDLNLDNRPSATEIAKLVNLFYRTYVRTSHTSHQEEKRNYEIEKQFKESEEYRQLRLFTNRQSTTSTTTTHSQAFYTSRILNPFTAEGVTTTTHPQAICTSQSVFNNDHLSECYECEIRSENVETLDSKYQQTSSQQSGITALMDSNLLMDSHKALKEPEKGNLRNSSQSSGVTTLIDNILISSHEELQEIPREEMEDNQPENKNEDALEESNIKKLIYYPKRSNDDFFTDRKHKQQKKE